MWDESDVQVSTGVMHASVWILQIVMRSPFVFSPNNIVRRHLDDILADYESHLVPEEYKSMLATSQWSYVDGYMTWFNSVSHPVMILYALECPPRPAHEEILENEQARDDHVIDVLSIWLNIMCITYDDIEFGLFERGGDDAVSLACFILTEARNALGYRQ